MDDTDRLQRPSKLVYAHFHASPLWTGIEPPKSCSATRRELIPQIRWWVDHLSNLLRVGEELRNAVSTEESVPTEILELGDVWGRVHGGHLDVGTARWIFGERLRSLLMITDVQPVIGWSEAAEGPNLSRSGLAYLASSRRRS